MASNSKKYTHAWKRLRDKYIMQQPYCEQCLKYGKQTLATQVHHIIPVINGGTNDKNNLMSVCEKCHRLIHIELNKK